MDLLAVEYYRFINLVISSCLDEIKKANVVELDDWKDRSGSSKFENFIKKYLRELNNNDFIDDFNNSFTNNQNFSLSWKLISVEAEEAKTESEKRAFYDFGLLIERPDGSVTSEKINIKGTMGKSADNVGGWASISYAIFGTPNLKKDPFLLAVRDADLNGGKYFYDNNLHDYFILTFNKSSKSLIELINSANIHSYLNTQLNAFVFNAIQPFPLQFKSHVAEHCFDDDSSIIERKKRICKMIRLKYLAYYSNGKSIVDY